MHDGVANLGRTVGVKGGLGIEILRAIKEYDQLAFCLTSIILWTQCFKAWMRDHWCCTYSNKGVAECR